MLAVQHDMLKDELSQFPKRLSKTQSETLRFAQMTLDECLIDFEVIEDMRRRSMSLSELQQLDDKLKGAYGALLHLLPKMYELIESVTGHKVDVQNDSNVWPHLVRGEPIMP